MLPFKDISYAQGAWNMDTDSDPIVAMKASGVYTSSKTPYLDTQLVRNYADAIRLGKVPVLYHFCGGGDPSMEAHYFLAAAAPFAKGDVYALDYEFDVADPVGWVQTFMNIVHAATGVWPWLYIDLSRLNAHDWSPVLNNSPLWCAAPSYGWNDTLPTKYTVSAQQGPIVNGVDTDMWFGDLEGIKKTGYGYQAPQAPAPPAPTPPPVQPTPTPDPVVTPPPPPVAPVETPNPFPTPINIPTNGGEGQSPSTPEPTPVTPNEPVVVTTPANKLGFLATILAWIKRLFR